jgi:hypothetical protein
MKNTLKITKAQIVISDNHLMPDGYAVETRLYGVLPGCRKEVLLYLTPSTKSIILRPLHTGNGEATIEPNEFAAFLQRIQIRNNHVAPYAEFDRVKASARASVVKICSCKAVTSPMFVSPNYTPIYDKLVTNCPLEEQEENHERFTTIRGL